MSDTTWPDTSHWSQFAAVATLETPEGRRAMESFCATFHGPVTSFLRRDGCSPEEAADLVQDFFLYVLGESRPLAGYDRDRGRFRPYLLAVLRNFRANRRRHDGAEKRGGGQVVLSIDHPAQSVADPSGTPEAEFTRAWAATLLDRVVAVLHQEASNSPRQRSIELLLSRLIDGRSDSYETMAAELNMSAGSLRVAAHRLRERFETLLRREIARTVSTPEEIDDEIREMFAAFSSSARR